jgi:hypothetical protein
MGRIAGRRRKTANGGSRRTGVTRRPSRSSLLPGRIFPLGCVSRLSPDENAAMRMAASHLRCPIGHLVRYMLGPVFQAYTVASKTESPGAPVWPQPTALPPLGRLAYDPREHQRQPAIDHNPRTARVERIGDAVESEIASRKRPCADSRVPPGSPVPPGVGRTYQSAWRGGPGLGREYAIPAHSSASARAGAAVQWEAGAAAH